MNKLNRLIEYGTYLFIFLLPWQTRWIWHYGELNGGAWEYGTYSLYGTEILLWLLVILKAIGRIAFKLQAPSVKHQKLLYCYIVILLFLIWSLLSIWWASDSRLALYWWFHLLEGVLLFWLIISTKIGFKKIAGVIVASALLQAGLGIWQFLTQTTFANKWLGSAIHSAKDLGTSVVEVGPERWLRAYGSLPHPNILAGWLVIGLLMTIYLYESQCRKENPSFFKIVILIYCYIAILFGLLATFSRGAWVAFTIVLLFYCSIAFLTRDKIKKIISYKLLIITVIVAAIFGMMFKAPLVTRLTSQGRLETKSHQERLTGYKEAGTLIKSNWLKGVGIGNYTLAVHNQIDDTRQNWAYQPVHNTWLLVLAELGIGGFILFVLIFLVTGHWSLVTRDKVISSLLLLGLFTLSLFDHYFWSLHFGIMMWWLILGLALSFSVRKN